MWVQTEQKCPIKKLPLHNSPQTLVYVCHTLHVRLTNTERELKGDERSIYLLTDVMNISA